MQDAYGVVIGSLYFIARAAIIYFFTLITVRLMGKRSIGELSAFDFVLMASIGDIMGTAALDRNLPFRESMLVLVTVASLEVLLSFIGIKNRRMAKLIEGTPTLLIDDGKLIKENMKKEKFNIFDLRQELRKEGVDDIRVVDKAYMEACGKFTVLLKVEEEAVKRKDLGILKEGHTPKYIDDKFTEINSELENLSNLVKELIIEVKSK